jgi:DNA-binding response OmpR family regulator
MARVKAVLRRSEEPAKKPRILEIGGYEIDGGKRVVVDPSGSKLTPTAREFDLLWFLAENQGIALSRGQILESVWGYEYFGETRTVDVHIRQLRKKIEGIPIETVWGVGYRLGD